MKCTVCGTWRDSNVCQNCGYDASCDFLDNRTLSPIPNCDIAHRRVMSLYYNKNTFAPPTPKPIINEVPPQPPIQTQSDKKKIIAISAGASHTVGLRADGTVFATGNNIIGRSNVSDW